MALATSHTRSRLLESYPSIRSGLPAWRNTWLASRRMTSTAGSLGMQNAGRSSGMNPAPPHSLYASRSTVIAESGQGNPIFLQPKRQRTAHLLVAFQQEPAIHFEIQLLDADQTSWIDPRDGHTFSLMNAGSHSRVRTRSSTCSSGSRFSISRLRSTGYAHWCAAKFSFWATSARILSLSLRLRARHQNRHSPCRQRLSHGSGEVKLMGHGEKAVGQL